MSEEIKLFKCKVGCGDTLRTVKPLVKCARCGSDQGYEEVVE